MPEKRMLIIDADVVKRVDENRGDMSYSEFVNYLIDSQLKAGPEKQKDNYATREDFHNLEKSVKDVLHSFLEFFLSYGLELGKSPTSKGFAELDRKLQELGNNSNSNSPKTRSAYPTS